MTGFGQGGDPTVRDMAGHDINYLAIAGILSSLAQVPVEHRLWHSLSQANTVTTRATKQYHHFNHKNTHISVQFCCFAERSPVDGGAHCQ